MDKTFYIDGIASSEALDTSGEIVSLKGLDTSSLIDAAISWEHKKDSPAQLVGKILEAKKIFGKEDCENPRQLYYWNKCQIAFLYIKARLFHDKPSSREVIALFKDDAQHPNEGDMLGFSVEGSKIEKVGAVITRSIARLVTLANHPANKSCIAEMSPEKEAKIDPNDVSELFKGEMQLFAFEPTYIQILDKKEELKKDVGSGGGAFIGSQLAMAEKKLQKDAPQAAPPPPPPPVTPAGISAGFNGAMGLGGIHKKESKKLKKDATVAPESRHGEHASAKMNPEPSHSEENSTVKVGVGIGMGMGGFGKAEEELAKAGWSKNPSLDNEAVKYSHKAHGDVKISKTPIGNFEVHHNNKLVGVSPNIGHAGKHAGKFMSSLGKLEKTEGVKWAQNAMGHHEMSHPSGNKFTIQSNAGGGGHKLQHTNSKGTTTTYSPFQSPEHAKTHAHGILGKEEKMEKALTAGSGMAAPGQLVDGAALARESLDRKKMHKKEKSKWYSRADEAYKTWDKREKFREYMKKRMPHLAEGEVDAIGKVLALKKSVQAEKNLSKMYASHFIKSTMKKQASGTDVMMAAEDKKDKKE